MVLNLIILLDFQDGIYGGQVTRRSSVPGLLSLLVISYQLLPFTFEEQCDEVPEV